MPDTPDIGLNSTFELNTDCPNCGMANEVAHGVGHDRTPGGPGDDDSLSLSFCFHCGGLSMFDWTGEKGNRRLYTRPLTDEEVVGLAADTEATALIADLRAKIEAAKIGYARD